MAIFYRVVSLAEYGDIVATATLRASPGAVEGKHLVGTLEHARAFASLLYGEEACIIVTVEVPDAAAGRFFPFAMLDGIGPAWFAELADLEGALVRQVTE